MNSSKLNRINLKTLYKEEPYLQPMISSFAIYIIFVYLLTLNPFQFSLFYFNRFIQFKRGYFAALIGGTYIFDIMLNLVMLFPVGLVIGLFLRNLKIDMKRSVIIATGLGFLISLSIEVSQIFLPRSFSLVDITTNTIGACIGAWLAYPVNGFDSQEILKKIYDKGRSFYTCVVIIYCVAATVVLMIPVSFNTFSNWNSNFPLLIGNEPTLNRPWNGIIYKLSIFNRTLNQNDVDKFYSINLQQRTPERLTGGLLIEYIFSNPSVQTFGAFKNSLYLIPRLESSFIFNQSGGIFLEDNSYIGTQSPAANLIQALKKTNQLSIAIWFQPENIQQKGPARIVTLSKDTDHRNFTLGQSGSEFSFRVRTPLNGHDGSNIELTTPPLNVMDKPQFLVVTFHRGEMKLYDNGRIVSSMIYDTSNYLPLLAGLSRDRFGKAAFCFMLLFPLGWFARGLVKFKVWKSIVSSLIAFFPFLILSLINTSFFHHQLDLHLFYLCLFISLLLLVIGFLYELILTQ
jgi:VanZ family protein